jgi:hypothetical protein
MLSNYLAKWIHVQRGHKTLLLLPNFSPANFRKTASRTIKAKKERGKGKRVTYLFFFSFYVCHISKSLFPLLHFLSPLLRFSLLNPSHFSAPSFIFHCLICLSLALVVPLLSFLKTHIYCRFELPCKQNFAPVYWISDLACTFGIDVGMSIRIMFCTQCL